MTPHAKLTTCKSVFMQKCPFVQKHLCAYLTLRAKVSLCAYYTPTHNLHGLTCRKKFEIYNNNNYYACECFNKHLFSEDSSGRKPYFYNVTTHNVMKVCIYSIENHCVTLYVLDKTLKGIRGWQLDNQKFFSCTMS